MLTLDCFLKRCHKRRYISDKLCIYDKSDRKLYDKISKDEHHPLCSILTTVKHSSQRLRRNIFRLPLVNTECFKNCFVNRLCFNYNLAIWFYFNAIFNLTLTVLTFVTSYMYFIDWTKIMMMMMMMISIIIIIIIIICKTVTVKTSIMNVNNNSFPGLSIVESFEKWAPSRDFYWKVSRSRIPDHKIQ